MREYTPDNITELKENEIFVFGSNSDGFHGKGAALIAVEKFGAKYGQASGLQGQSYAIVTKKDWRFKSSTIDEIRIEIIAFLYFAHKNPNLIFFVTKIGSGLGGYNVEEIKNIFMKFKGIGEIPDNVILPREYEVRD